MPATCRSHYLYRSHARTLLALLLLLLLITVTGCGPDAGRDRPGDPGPAGTADTTAAAGLSSDFITYEEEAAAGATVYVPVYSHIYQRDAERTFNLTATLSIRNTDLAGPVTIRKVYYYDSKGALVQKFLDRPQRLAPLSSVSYVVEEDDLRGGVGANFLVLWDAGQAVSEPVIEAVMISAAQNQGISFTSVGRTVHSLQRGNP